MNSTQIEKAYGELPKKQNLTVSMKRLEMAYGISHGYLVRALENFDTSQGITLEHFSYLVESEFIRLESAESGSALALHQSVESALTQPKDTTPYYQDLNEQLREFQNIGTGLTKYEREVTPASRETFNLNGLLDNLREQARDNLQREENIRSHQQTTEDALAAALQAISIDAAQRGQSIANHVIEVEKQLKRHATQKLVQQYGLASQPAPKEGEPGDGSPQ